MKRILFLMAILFCATNAHATTYYISVAGNDANNGTSKSTPWRHAPGMPDATGVPLTIDNNSGGSGNAHPGDQFILRGGDSWTQANGDLPWTWRSSGVPGNIIYLGVDLTWFTGASWTRPVLDLSNQMLFSGGSTSGAGLGAAFRFGGSGQSTYNTVDNFEFINWQWTGACTGACLYGPFAFSSGGASNYDGNTLEHAYFHNWHHSYITGDTDGCVIVAGQSSNVLYTVFDGSDSSGGGDSCYGTYFAGTDNNSEIAYNYFYGTANGSVGSYPLWHDNVDAFLPRGYSQITSGSYHGNVIENNVCFSPCFIYNNVSLNTTPAAGVTFWDSPTGTDYLFNNVVVNTTNGNVIDSQTGTGGQSHGGQVVAFNNTVECGHDNNPPANVCIGDTTTALSTFDDNHWITSDTTPIVNLGVINSPNTRQDLAAANAQGYSLSQTPYVFAPTSGGNVTVGSGNPASTMQARCTTIAGLNAAAGAACKNDTTYAVSYNATTHSVTYPARTVNVRPVSGNWDLGAYQFTSSPPAPIVSLSPTSIPFPSQIVSTPSSPQVITLTNTGTATLTISSIALTGANAAMFGSSTTCGGTLAASANCTVSVTFTPSSTGAKSAAVTFTTNAASSPDNIALTGTGINGGTTGPTTPTGKVPYTLAINVPVIPPISILPSTLPAATEGVAYKQQIAASGCGSTGTSPCTCSVVAGALPTGLALSPTCLLSGIIPLGTFSASTTVAFTIQAQ